MKNIVISAINFSEAGPLTILRSCLKFLSDNLSGEYSIIALVHKKDLFDIPGVTYHEFPDSKKSWFKRVYYEYVHFGRLSRLIKPHLWLSMHDMTPNVEADILAVYCHNSAAFYKPSFNNIFLEPKLILFSLFYRHLYRINIRKNDYVIVQQDWMRGKFKKTFALDNVIVAHPEIDLEFVHTVRKKEGGKYKFFYPSFPRLFKNFEVICDATQILGSKGMNNFEVLLTIDGSETRYSRSVYDRYKSIPSVKFIGLQPKRRILELYDESDCMIFPSKLESWGIPIAEFKKFGKPIFLADLEYAHETAGNYDKVKFFDPDDSVQLSHLMKEVIENRLVFKKARSEEIKPPYAPNWKELFNILLNVKEIDRCPSSQAR